MPSTVGGALVATRRGVAKRAGGGAASALPATSATSVITTRYVVEYASGASGRITIAAPWLSITLGDHRAGPGLEPHATRAQPIEVDGLVEDHLDAAVDGVLVRAVARAIVATTVGGVESGSTVAAASVISSSTRFVGAAVTPSRPSSIDATLSIASTPSVPTAVPDRLHAEHGLRQHRVARRIHRVDRDVEAEVDVERRALVLGPLLGRLMRVAIEPPAARR